MTDSLLTQPGAAASRPSHIPEKFWDPQAGGVRTDALAGAYTALERRMGSAGKPPQPGASPQEVATYRRGAGIPDTPQGYAVTVKHPAVTPDAEVNKRLHDAHLTPDQVQVVYDLAAERMIPIIHALTQEFNAERQRARLVEAFGGDGHWQAASREMATWGKAHLPPDVFAAMAASHDGVMALSRLMGSGEPLLGAGTTPNDAPAGEDALKSMMQDPRYWKKKDPAYIARVEAGFKRLYPSGM